MNSWSDRVKTALRCGDEVLACAKHEVIVREAIFGNGEVSDELITRLFDEVMPCLACSLIVPLVTGNPATLPSFERAELDGVEIATISVPSPIELRKQIDAELGTPAWQEQQRDSTPSGSSPGASSQDAEKTIVHGFRKCPGEEASRTLRSGGRGLHAVDSMRVLGMFDIGQHHLGKNNEQHSTCVVVLWQFPRGVHHVNNGQGIAVDEMAFYLRGGDATWSVQGGNSIRLDVANQDCPNLLWMGADPRGDILGLPPFDVTVESDAAYGVAVLYDAWGVPWVSSGKSRQISVTGRPWSAEEIDRYWAAAERHVHQMSGRRPFAERLPFGGEAVEELALFKRRKIEGYAHDKLKRQGALVDRFLRRWPAEQKADFQHKAELKRLDNQRRRNAPVLDFCLVELPAKGASIAPAKIDAARHEQSFEVMVPIAGEISWYGVEPEHRDRDSAGHATVGSFRSKGRTVHEDVLKAADHGAEIPDIFMLDSSYFHAFVAARNAVAVAINIRCYDYDPHGERRRVRDDANFTEERAAAQGGRR